MEEIDHVHQRRLFRTSCALGLLLLHTAGCTRKPVNRQGEESTQPPRPVDSVKVASPPHELVQPDAVPAAVRETCDSVALLARKAIGLDFSREDGSYFDSAKEVPRVGCRLTGHGSFAALPSAVGPVDAVYEAFKSHGWRADLRYMADGPDGEDVGIRRRDMLCQVIGHWDGGDDSEMDSTPRPPTAEENRYEAIVECARDVSSNEDAGVPDSIWQIASRAGLDSVYAISVRLQYPPYLDGDFDGDGVQDAAVLIEARATGKTGIAILRPGPRQVSILGAGAPGEGPDDLSWLDTWDVFHKGATMHLTIGDRPSSPLIADALWVARRDSASGFYLWTGSRYDWDSHTQR